MSSKEIVRDADARRRAKAEKRIRDLAEVEPRSAEESAHLLHELQVHQLELEMQNEELRQAQRELETSRSRYFELYDLAPVGYLTLDEHGVIVDANLTAATLLGVTRAGLAHHALTRFIARADQEVFFRHRRMLEHSGVAQVCELRMARRDGHTFWARLEESPPADGARINRLAISDISAKKVVEETLKASELRHRTLFEGSRDALLTVTPPSCAITSANARALELLGANGVASRALWEFAPATQASGRASQEELEAQAVLAMRNGSVDFEWTLRRASGEDLLASATFTRLVIDDQPVLHAILRDQTEVKLLQAQVAQADRLSSMGLLAAGVAHEINNPLTFMLYNLEDAVAALTLPGPPSPEILEDLAARTRETHAGAQRIRKIARALSSFARTDPVAGVPLDVNEALEAALTMSVNEIRHRARLIKELGSVPPVLASEGRLSQVFLNLLINAAHAIPEGDADHHTITVRTWQEDHQVFVEVRDTGQGIAPADLGRVFEPFYTRKTTTGGSGLGLAISDRIVHDLGGAIRVESTVGVGSCFVVRLPAAPGSPVPVARASSTSVAPPPRAPDTPRGRVLLVDDEPAIIQVITRLLRPHHDIVGVTSGLAALAILEKDPAFDVIICDLMMPQMTGTELHAHLAARDPDVAGRVLFMSGGAFTPRASAYLASTGIEVLHKPVPPAQLLSLVDARVRARHVVP